jgi:hypothetical protein
MANLETVLNTTETQLIAILKTAWGVSKVHTQPQEIEPTAATLPEAYLLQGEIVPAEEEESVMCSESGRVQWSAMLHATKPTTGQLIRAKRAKAQLLRSALAGATLTYSGQARWEGETYDVMEGEVQARSGAYLIRVSFSTFVDWED